MFKERVHLFTARTLGYHHYRVPGICVSPNGVALATAEARRGKGGDWDDNDIVMRRSSDDGKTWDEQRAIVASPDYGPGPISNFSMIADPDQNCVHALFCHNYARVFATRSDDDGASWDEPRDVTESFLPLRSAYDWKVIATGPGHGILLSGGRMVVPLWLSDGSGTEFGAGKLGHRPSVVASAWSDDRGATWQAGDIVMRDGQNVPLGTGSATIVNPSETVAVELADGSVLFNARTESAPHRRMIAVSPNGADAWSTPHFDDALLDPVCMGSILRVGDTVLFANPDNLEKSMTNPTSVNCDRKRLTVKLSRDDAATWTAARVLEEGPSGYSDLAVTPAGTVLCIHEDQVINRMCDDQYVSVQRFDVEWVMGKDQGQ